MTTFRQHVPNFVELDRQPEPVTVTTLRELYMVPWIGYFLIAGPYRFEVDRSATPLLLIAVLPNAHHVAGYLDNDDVTADLPTWKPKPSPVPPETP